MKISAMGKYAVRTLIDIARCESDDYVSIQDISSRQGISTKYLEAIISRLTKGGILASMRGAQGGYKLKKSPKDVTLKEILNLTGDGTKLATCFERDCPLADSCESISVWRALTQNINSFLERTTLQNMLDNDYK